MRSIVSLAAIAVLLSGCLPMALFANGSGPAYNSYAQNFGTYVASNRVNAFCISPKLRLAIWEFEGYFGRKVVMNSGFRDPFYNAKVGGSDDSYHMKCMAADFFIPGVSKRDLIRYAMRNGKVGGLGCYPARGFIHVDVRERPRGWRTPVTFSGC
jgi:zinc D-Ala-D-Ala carboxypeptidase